MAVVTAAKIMTVYENPFRWLKPRKPMAKAMKKAISNGPACAVFPLSNNTKPIIKQRAANPKATVYGFICFKVLWFI